MNTIIDVKKIRDAKGLTQKELANLCGVTIRTVQNWENGGTIPDMVKKYLTQIDEQSEIISSSANGNSVSVAAGKGSNVNVGKETERLLSLLEQSQGQINELLQLNQEQFNRLMSVIEKLTK